MSNNNLSQEFDLLTEVPQNLRETIALEFKEIIKKALISGKTEYNFLIKNLFKQGLDIVRENSFGKVDSTPTLYEKQLVSIGYFAGLSLSTDSLKRIEIEILRELEENKNNLNNS
jgi:hypothetical protein